MSVKQIKKNDEDLVKQKKSYNYNQQTHYIGFRCPNDLFNSTLKNKNYTKTIVNALRMTPEQINLPQKSETVKQSEILTLKQGVLEFNKLMEINIKRIELTKEIDIDKIKEAVKRCR